jgi:hypothetical protein
MAKPRGIEQCGQARPLLYGRREAQRLRVRPMNRSLSFLALAAGCLPGVLGCGGASGHTTPTQLESGGSGTLTSAGDGGALATAGSGGSLSSAGGESSGGNLANAGQAGLAGWKPTCGTATPLLAVGSGFENCTQGYVRRVGPAHCTSKLPRATAVPGYDAAVDSCKLDTDCPSAMYGPYAHCDTRFGGNAHVCVRGCIVDPDCETGQVCLCGDPVGRCVPSSCDSSADCGPGKDCASFETGPSCFSTQFGCQTSSDSCSSASDCRNFSMNPSFCAFVQPGARGCTVAQCFGP